MFSNLTIKKKMQIMTTILVISIAMMVFISTNGVKQLNSSQKELAIQSTKMEEIDEVISAHYAFIANLERALIEGRKFNGQVDHTLCGLGKWWKNLKNTPEYQEMQADLKEGFKPMLDAHEILHKSADNYNKNYIHYDKKLESIVREKKIDHLNWSSKLSEAIIAKQIPQIQTDYTKCKFGQWFANYKNGESFTKLPNNIKQWFFAIETPHKNLHQSAKIIISFMKDKKYDEAMQYYKTNTLKNLHKVDILMDKILGELNRYEALNLPIEQSIEIDAFKQLDIILKGLEEYESDLDKKIAHAKEQGDYIAHQVDLDVVTISAIVALVLLFMMLINNGIIKSIEKFEAGLLTFFRYLNKETKDVETLDDSSADELGTMAKVVNSNISKTKQAIEEDQRVIDDTITVLAEFEKGDLSKRVTTTSSNEALQELTTLLNKMAGNLENNIENVLDILDQYSHKNYMNKVSTTGLKEHLLKLANGVNVLGEAITDMLIENKKNGLALDKSSDILLDNVKILNANTTQAAAALEQTAASIEELRTQIHNSSDSIIDMGKYSHGVKSTVAYGLGLATKTTTSMNEIDEEVNSINDAIMVIDQIAFQTNILSLNAAVEAATAGEAGKGFAVVAQEVRNLANRSAEAANEIKHIVATATTKANNGKTIASEMIKGYTELEKSISETFHTVTDVQNLSNEQFLAIEQISDAVHELDRQTQQTASVANQTHEVAVQTDTIAKLVVSNSNENQFHGKDNIKANDIV